MDIKFIRAEYSGASGKPFNYFWKCNRCGNVYRTWTTQTNGFCSDCKKLNEKERIMENEKRSMEKLKKKIFSRIKRGVNFADIPSITVNGVLYYQAKEIEKALYNLVEEQTDGNDD